MKSNQRRKEILKFQIGERQVVQGREGKETLLQDSNLDLRNQSHSCQIVKENLPP